MYCMHSPTKGAQTSQNEFKNQYREKLELAGWPINTIPKCKCHAIAAKPRPQYNRSPFIQAQKQIISWGYAPQPRLYVRSSNQAWPYWPGARIMETLNISQRPSERNANRTRRTAKVEQMGSMSFWSCLMKIHFGTVWWPGVLCGRQADKVRAQKALNKLRI